jgi:hypothetical protein
MRLIVQLLPLLLAASPAPAHIVSVFSPKRDDKIFPKDLSLRDPKHYNFMNSGSHVSYMTTFFMEELAKKYPGQLSLVHCYPGIVMTDGFKNPRLPKWFRIVFTTISPLVRQFTVPRGESGARIIFNVSSRFPARPKSENVNGSAKSGYGGQQKVEIASSSDGMLGGGAYRVDWDGETVPKGKIYKSLEEAGMAQKVWDHTTDAFQVIEGGGVFKG